VTGHLLFEGEVLSGGGDYRDPQVRGRVEQAARAYMNDLIRGVLDQTIEWQTDPVGFGMRFRSKFPTWVSWVRYDWRRQISRLQVRVTTDMRIRRVGIIHSNPRKLPGG